MLLLLLVFHFRWAILLPSRCRIVGMGMNAVNNEEKKTRNCQSRNDKEKKKSYIDTKWSEAKSISMRRLRWSFGDFGLQIGFVSHPGRDGWKLFEFIQSSTLLFASRCRSISWDFCCCRREKREYKPRFDVMSRWWGKGERRKGRSTRVGLSWRCQSIATLLIDVLGAAPGKRRMWRCSHKLVIQWVCRNEIAINMELFSILYTLSFHFWIKAFVL